MFCGTYTLSCLLTALCVAPLYLLVGRILGGISTSILFSAFESWMVTEWTNLRGKLEYGGVSLSYLFGILTQVNSITAIVAGVASESLVQEFGTLTAPFLTACILLGVAGGVIAATWVGFATAKLSARPWTDKELFRSRECLD